MALLGLFVASFLAATLLPGGSEALLLLMVEQQPQQIVLLVIVASVGNSFGSISSYGLGYVGRVKFSQAQFSSRSAKLIERFGHWVLLLSWLPLIGDILCVMAGYFKLAIAPSVILITIGKTLRYILLVYGFMLLR
ncbi:MAG: DedA family protein [Gammaproteobacteria bacterium]|nr:DedA family protein [Gammaproteobacteria bacterium]